MKIEQGARVWIPRFRCHGTVVRKRHGGHELGLRLDPPLGITVWVRRDELAADGEEDVTPAVPPSHRAGTTAPAHPAAAIRPEPPPAPAVTPVPPPEQPAVPAKSRAPASGTAGRAGPGLLAAQQRLDAMDSQEKSRWRRKVGRNVVEALKFGIVPRFGVEALSAGLDRERKVFEADIARARSSGAVRVLLAPYGTGKTHALDVIESMALREGFVVARADLDAFECKPGHPRHVYRSLAASVRLPEGSGGRGLAWLLDAGSRDKTVLDSLARRRSRCWHEFLGPALLNWRALAGDEAAREHLYQWISGEDVDLEQLRLQCAAGTARTKLLSLGGYTTLSSHFCYQLSGISELARLLGYSGLTILLDEAEHMRLLSSRLEKLAQDLFRGLVYNAVGQELPDSYLKSCYFGGRKKFPFHWRLPAQVYFVVACTPVPEAESHLEWLPSPDCVTELPRGLSERDLETLAQRIATVYEWAGHGVTASPDRNGSTDFLATPSASGGGTRPLQLEPEARRRIAQLFSEALEAGCLQNVRQVVQTLVEGLDRLHGLPGWSWPRIIRELEVFVDGGM